MRPTALQPLLRFVRVALEPPAPIANAHPRQLLQPNHRAHQLHLLKWAATQLSAFGGVVLIILAIDFTQWLPEWLGFLEVLAQLGDFTAYFPAQWRWVGVTLVVMSFVAQLPLTFVAVWAEWRTTWYVISDQGVQLRHGFWTIHETSLRFANIQQVTLKQGPLQRMLDLADVVLSTAGGRPNEDDDDDQRKKQGQLRDLAYPQAQSLLTEIRNQLPSTSEAHPPRLPTLAASLEAAQLLLNEARALRQTLAQPSKGTPG